MAMERVGQETFELTVGEEVHCKEHEQLVTQNQATVNQ